MRKFIIDYGFPISLCMVSVAYMAIAMLFLNDVYAQGRLFAWQRACGINLYFSQDVFDVFWLILAAIPNGVFSLLLFKRLFISQPEDRKFLYIAIALASLVFLVLLHNASEYTAAFNNNSGVWSSELPTKTATLYLWLERTSAFIISVEISNVCCGIIWLLNKDTPQEELAPCVFISSIILAMYWSMLILSGIVNDKYLRGRAGSPLLFPKDYYYIGLAITFLVALCFFVFLKHSTDKANSLKSIITAIVIPGIPIAIQILQIILPQNS